jgi:CRISPR-associated protein Csx16
VISTDAIPTPSLDDLLCSRPRTLTIAQAEACLPSFETNPEWQAKHDAGELPEGLMGMVGCMRAVWPEERLTEEEARWLLAMREHLSWRSLADFVTGDGNQITGMHLEEAARRALEGDCMGEPEQTADQVVPPRPTTYLVTRHSGAKQWVEEEGIAVDAQLDHLEIDRVRAGDIVIGSLPVNLAAQVCARGGRYFHLSLELPYDWRGRELSPNDMRRFGARVEEFFIRKCGDVGK